MESIKGESAEVETLRASLRDVNGDILRIRERIALMSREDCDFAFAQLQVLERRALEIELSLRAALREV